MKAHHMILLFCSVVFFAGCTKVVRVTVDEAFVPRIDLTRQDTVKTFTLLVLPSGDTVVVQEAKPKPTNDIVAIWRTSGVRRISLKDRTFIDVDTSLNDLHMELNMLVGTDVDGDTISVNMDDVSHVQIIQDSVHTFDENGGMYFDSAGTISGVTSQGVWIEAPVDDIIYFEMRKPNRVANALIIVLSLAPVIAVLATGGFGF